MTVPQTASLEPQALQGLPNIQLGDASFQGAERRENGLGELLGLLWERKLLFAMLFLALCAAAGVQIALLVPAYTASALLDLDPRQPHYADLPNVVSNTSENPDLSLDLVRSEMQVLQSPGLARRVIKSLHLQDDPHFLRPDKYAWLERLLPWNDGRGSTAESQLEAATRQYAKELSLFNDGRSFVISASFTTGTPKLATSVLAKHIELYRDEQRAYKQQAIARAQGWLMPELAQLKAKLSNSEAALQAYQDAHQLTRTGGETVAGRQLTALTEQLVKARTDLAAKVARAAALENGVHDTQQLSSETLARLRDQEAEASKKLAGMRSRFGGTSPYLVGLTATLADVRQRIAAELDRMRHAASSDVAAARDSVARLGAQAEQAQRQVVMANNDSLVAIGLQREVDAQSKLYDDLLGRQQQVEAQYEIQDADARVVSPPLAPQQPSFPRRGLLGAIAACASALLAGLMALALERLRGESRSLGEIERSVGVIGFASIPRLRSARLRAWPPMLEPLTQEAASIQALVNSLAFQSGGMPPRIVAVVSAVPGEGKTTIASLLATSLAQNGARVLLVDADMRRRALSRRTRLSLSVGLIGLLERGGSVAQAVVRDERAALDILAAERSCANPYRFMRDGTLAAVLAEARASYDTVVIDTPPLAAADDALPFAVAAEATIVVASYGSTPTAALRGALQRLRMAGARNLGVALNRVPRHGQAYQPGLESVRSVPRLYFGADV